MSIVWKYLDKRAAVIAALKDYSVMQFIIANTDENIKAVHEEMTSLGNPSWDKLPKAPNPHAGEERLARSIDKIDVLRERYRQALEYMAWFQPAWDGLSSEEREVISEFYMVDDQQQIDAVYNICERFNIERSSAYNKKNRALNKLVGLMYGKE